MSLRDKITLVVNSCDSYSDAWDPYFKLLEAYWPDRECDVVLNTESKDLECAGDSIRVSHTPIEGKAAAWSERLRLTLEGIRTPYVIYVQEDYFLNGIMDTQQLGNFLSVIEGHDIDCIRIRETGVRKHLNYTEWDQDDRFMVVPKEHGYYATTQVALWKKDSLHSIVRDGESVWEFERAATRRARNSFNLVLAPNPTKYPNWDSGIYPYEPTGIVRAKWYRPAVEELFAKHGISVDFEDRGWFEPTAWERLKQKLRSKARQIVMRY